MKPALFYKATRPDGFDFRTGNTINYRECLQKGIPAKCPAPDKLLGLCSAGVIHASKTPGGVFVVATLPLALFRVKGIPILVDVNKCGFLELEVVEELNPASVFEWNYTEAVNPVNPFSISPPTIEEEELALLEKWASVGDSVRASVGASMCASVRDSVKDSVGASVGASVRDSVRDWVSDSVENSVRALVKDSVGASVWDSVKDSVGASMWDSVWDIWGDSVENSVRALVWAYIGSLFTAAVKEWRYIDHPKGVYPFQPVVDLWKRGLVPSFDGKLWRFHGGAKAEVLWEGAV